MADCWPRAYWCHYFRVYVTVTTSARSWATRAGWFSHVTRAARAAKETRMTSMWSSSAALWSASSKWHSCLTASAEISATVMEVRVRQNKFTNSNVHLSYIPQYTIQNRNVHISVLNGALWDMGQVYCGICEIDLMASAHPLVVLIIGSETHKSSGWLPYRQCRYWIFLSYGIVAITNFPFQFTWFSQGRSSDRNQNMCALLNIVHIYLKIS